MVTWTSLRRRRLTLVLLFATLVVGGTGAAHAQSQPRTWVEVRFLAERDASFGFPSAGAVFGGAAGVDWRRLGLRFEFDVPVVHEGTVISSYSDGPVLVRTTAQWRRRSPSWNAAAAWTPAGSARYSMSVLAGWANVNHYSAPDVVTVEHVAGDGTLLERRDYTSVAIDRWWPGVVVGLDIAVVLGRAAIVSEVRLMAFPLSDVQGDYIARAGVTFRWRF
jgi:hypothetical protein